MVNHAVYMLLSRQEAHKDTSFNRNFGHKNALRGIDEELAHEEDQNEIRIERARSFMFKAFRFSSLNSGQLQGKELYLPNKIGPIDEEKEERCKDESPRQTNVEVPQIQFYEAQKND